jgi:hypothetical protein
VYDELSDRFTLLAFGATDEAVAGFDVAASRLGTPLHILRDDAAGGRERYGAKLILVRPDQFVAWAGDEARPNADAILAHAIGRRV